MGLQATFLDLFFPRRCVVCTRENAWLCSDCSLDIKKEIYRFGISYTEVKALFSFNQVAIRELLHNLKYNGIYEVVPVLVALADSLQLLQQIPIKPEHVLVPVPTTNTKIKGRGYNQAELLARGLGSYFNLPVDTTILFRQGGSGSQVGKDAVERGMSENSFSINSEACQGKHILLVDDVCTTGSTFRKCETVLREGKCASLEGLVMARK